MNAIEIRDLSKRFGEKRAVDGLNMTVPVGAIYGFIGENGSGKSTTEKLICDLQKPTSGSISLFGKPNSDPAVRRKTGALIEAPGCFPNLSVWNNMLLQASNLSIRNPEKEIARALKTVRMEGAASNKFKNCSLGMKQRIGIAMTLIGNPRLLILDEPINGLDADGMRIMREVLTEITQTHGCTVLISSHILDELQKIATHYGIIRRGKMLRELTSEQLDAECPSYVSVKVKDINSAESVLRRLYPKVERDEDRRLRVYGASGEEVVKALYENSLIAGEVMTKKISLSEYYTELMDGGRK